MNKQDFRRIQVRIRFLKHACDGGGIHPFDTEEAWQMCEDLSHLKLCELDSERLSFVEVSTAIHELEGLLSREDGFC